MQEAKILPRAPNYSEPALAKGNVVILQQWVLEG